MSMTAQPIPNHPRWEAWKRSFTQSNYITDFWMWLLTLLSKSAELVLFGSILYSSYQLVPGVDAFLFLVKQAALDIGGMGLLKLARRAGPPRTSFPVQVGVTLVVLMILNVVLATLKHALPIVPGSVFFVIEAVLLVARAVMAVLFGHAIHALREEYSESTITVKDAHALREQIEGLAVELAQVQQSFHKQLAMQEQQLHMQMQSEMKTLQEAMHVHLQAMKASVQLQVQQDITSLQEALQSAQHLHADLQTNVQALEATLQAKQVAKSTCEVSPRLRVVPFSEQEAMKAKGQRFDSRSFVFACLQRDATLSIAMIKQLARESKQTLSDSTICRYRQQFFAAGNGAVKAANQ